MDFSYNLDFIGRKHQCDKSTLHHGYCVIYSAYLPSEPKGIEMLEIGYGGYDDPSAGGESARMWKEWAPKMDLTVIDLYPKNNIPEGVNFVRGSQTDLSTYDGLGDFDVIIDDGSHINFDIISTIQILWHRLKSGGLYIVEDLHSSYDPYYSDSHPIPNGAGTAMAFFTRLAHEVNRYFYDPSAHMGYDVEFVHFYKDLVIIKKA